MSIGLSCPSCNHAFALAALPEHRRATCLRCGDVFPIRTYTELPDENAPSVEGEPAKVIAPRTRRSTMSLIVNGAALLLIVAGVGWVAFAVSRKMRESESDRPGATRPDASAASELAGLGYLRPGSNIVFAFRTGPLLAHAARTGQQPGEALRQTGLPDFMRGTVEQLGVPLAQIDHLVGGFELGEGEDALRLTLVLVLKQPSASEDEFLSQLKARPVPEKRDRYDVAVGRFGMLLARVSPTVWVFGLDERDLSAIDTGGYRPPASQFRGDEHAGLRGMIHAVPANAAVWVAADDDGDWTQKPVLKLVGNAPEMQKLLPVMKDGRGGVLAVRLGEQPRLQLRVRAADSATAERVRAYFATQGQETPAARSGGEGTFAEFDAPFNAETGKLLQRFLNDAAK